MSFCKRTLQLTKKIAMQKSVVYPKKKIVLGCKQHELSGGEGRDYLNKSEHI